MLYEPLTVREGFFWWILLRRTVRREERKVKTKKIIGAVCFSVNEDSLGLVFFFSCVSPRVLQVVRRVHTLCPRVGTAFDGKIPAIADKIQCPRVVTAFDGKIPAFAGKILC